MTDGHDDRSETALEYPELPPELERASFLTLARSFGPGAIMASITIGSGETVFASRSGAVFGYSLLWLFFIAAIAKGFQVYSGARHITLTGEHPLASWNRLPGLRWWFPTFVAVLTVLCFPFWLGGLPKMLGQLVNWIVGIAPESEHYRLMVRVWGTSFIVVAVVITALQTYKLLENAQAVIVGLLLVSLLAAGIASRPDLVAIVVGTIVPSMPDAYPAWALEKYPRDFGTRPLLREFAVYVGAMGGGTQDYVGYIGILREKSWGLMKRFHTSNPDYGPGTIALPLEPEQVLRGRRWLRAPVADVTVSFTCIVIFTYVFVILGAEILHPQELAPVAPELLTVQEGFLTQIHPSLTYLYQVGVFMAFFGTILGAFEIYTRTAHESLMAVCPPLRKVAVGKVRPWVLGYSSIGALVLLWSDLDPVRIVTPAAILGSVLTCGLWCFAAAYADRALLPRPYRMSRFLLGCLLVSGVLLTVLGAGAVVQFFLHG